MPALNFCLEDKKMQELICFKNPGLYTDGKCSEMICSWDELCDKKVVRVVDGVLSGSSTVSDNDCLAGVLVLPECVEQICDFAFTSERRLRGLIALGSLKSIGKSAFEGCDSLETVDARCEHIGESAFMRCPRLRMVYNRAGSTVIADSAFCWCISLEEVVLPKNVAMQQKAFFGCNKDYSIEYV